MDSEKLLKRLVKPTGNIDVVIDTDTFNEIDDQYALSLLIKSCDKLNLKAIYAAPFFNEKSFGPEDGMEKSYQEILNIIKLCKREDYEKITYKGSRNYLIDEEQPVDSPAARNLVELAMEREEDNPLYVVAIGAITNIASAILMEPEIIEKIVVIWLGGNAHEWMDNREFNLHQDIAAARVVFSCSVPLVQLPCAGVVSSFYTTGPELTYWLKGRNSLCDYLVETTVREGETMGDAFCWSRVIWDVTAVAWLLDGDYMQDRLEHSPIPEYDGHYAFDKRRHFIRYVYAINRDKLFEKLIKTLADLN